MKVVLAGGTGALGRAVASHWSPSAEVVILTRRPRSDIPYRQVVWDGRSCGTWHLELRDSVLLNLAGALVDRRPTAKNIALLKSSRVEPTSALVAASKLTPPAVWLQMSTLAIYGDAGEEVLDEGAPPAAGPAQMAGVAREWEASADGAAAERLLVLRTGIVLDRDTPALDRLVHLVRRRVGGRVASGQQWVSWIHVGDFLRSLDFLVASASLSGTVHLTAPEPVRNVEMMRTLRRCLGRGWAPPTPRPVVHVGAWLLRTDPALALTGRRCVPRRLLEAGFDFEHPTFESAAQSLLLSPTRGGR